MLENASKLRRFFKEVKGEPMAPQNAVYYRLKTVEEYEADGGTVKSKETRKYIFAFLDDIIRVCYSYESDPMEQLCDRVDKTEFVDLLKRMLVLNQDFRLSPTEGLDHKFITMAHLQGYSTTN